MKDDKRLINEVVDQCMNCPYGDGDITWAGCLHPDYPGHEGPEFGSLLNDGLSILKDCPLPKYKC